MYGLFWVILSWTQFSHIKLSIPFPIHWSLKSWVLIQRLRWNRCPWSESRAEKAVVTLSMESTPPTTSTSPAEPTFSLRSSSTWEWAGTGLTDSVLSIQNLIQPTLWPETRRRLSGPIQVSTTPDDSTYHLNNDHDITIGLVSVNEVYSTFRIFSRHMPGRSNHWPISQWLVDTPWHAVCIQPMRQWFSRVSQWLSSLWIRT